MLRSTRAAVGGVTVLVLLLVAAVSGLVALVAGGQLREGTASEPVPSPEQVFVDPVTAQAEVLDVDGVPADGWLSADVAFDTGTGREVAYLDLGPQDGSGAPPPRVGDVLEVVHERSDPGFVLRADDPALTGAAPDEGPGPTTQAGARAAAQALVDRTRVLALSALVLAVVAGLLTVVAVRRAPPPRGWAEAAGPQPSGVGVSPA